MKHGLIAFAAGVVLSTAALADPMANVFGNTLKIEENGVTSLWYMNEDGTFTTDSNVSGTWTLEGDNMCVTIGDAAPSCGPIEVRTLGESWTEDNGQGGTRTATLVEGR